MKRNHNFFSNLALNLAENNLGKTSSNPSVGCVVVKDGAVISSGFTSISGRPHAEFNALNKNYDFKGSNLYVSLEPCTHYGLTPPCTDIIKKKKIKSVYYCFEDPDKRTFKNAKKYLKKYKIISKKIKIKKNNIYESYYLNKTRNLPFIDAKIAISNDYFTINKKSKWITNLRSRKVGNFLRSRYDCIVSTSSTINKDNPLLNCRINGLNNFKPDLVILDRDLKIKKNLRIFDISNRRKTYIFTSSRNQKKIRFLKKKNIKFFDIGKLIDKNDFINLFKKLFLIGKKRILFETGLIFLNQLIRYKLVNNLYVFKSKINLENYGSNNTKVNYFKKYRLNNKIKVNLNDDILFKVRIK